MRAFLSSLIGLAVLVAAQNVMAISPAPTELVSDWVSFGVDGSPLETVSPTAQAAPSASSVGLLVAGLAGLTAAGNRSRRLADERRRT